MLKLPKIPYSMDKDKQQTVAMGSINYSKMTQDGDVADSSGISGRYFPYITTAKVSSPIGNIKNCESATLFNGGWVQVNKNGELYYNGELIGNLDTGEKQFAAINTKLVIMPDKKYLDISGEKPTLRDMGVELSIKKPIFTENSLSLGQYHTTVGGISISEDSTFEATSIDEGVEVNFVIEEENQSKWRCTVLTASFYATPQIVNRKELLGVDLGDTPLPCLAYIFDWACGKGGWYKITNNSGILTLDREYEWFSSEAFTHSLDICVAGENDYFKTRGYKKLTVAGKEMYVYVYENRITYPFSGVRRKSFYIDRALCDGPMLSPKTWWSVKVNNGGCDEDFAGDLDTALSESVSPDDIIRLTFENKGEPYYLEGKVAEVYQKGIRFADLRELCGKILPDEISNSAVKIFKTGLGCLDAFSRGDVVTVTDDIGQEFSFQIDTVSPDGYVSYAASNVFAEKSFVGGIKIERRIPNMDYICENDNRLYGCSIADNMIYASALGDPTNIYTYQGVSTDSYAVAVASEGPFTGCCPYDGGVMFWKSDKLHKLLGSYPAEYALYTYNIDGVQQGSHRSLQNINEVLFYKGDRGIFAFDGSPRLISENFGDKHFESAVGGSDGERYYVSMVDKDGRSHFFSYNTRSGLWVREGDLKASSFTRSGKDVYMLEGSEIKLYGAEETPKELEWFIQFTPIYETIEGKKSYSRIKLRAEIPRGSHMAISIRCDGGRWAECGKIVGKREGIVPVMVPVNRCDKFELKISGKGPCTIHSILREYYVGGDG